MSPLRSRLPVESFANRDDRVFPGLGKTTGYRGLLRSRSGPAEGWSNPWVAFRMQDGVFDGASDPFEQEKVLGVALDRHSFSSSGAA